MSYFTIGPWEMIIDVIGLCLCGVTIVYLIRDRIQGKIEFPVGVSSKRARSFTDEVEIQLIRQQYERAFEKISDIVRSERRLTKKMIAGRGIKDKTNPLILKGKVQYGEHLGGQNKEGQYYDDSSNGQYAKAAKLADLGLGVEEIYEKVKVAKSEIQLILNLKKLRD